MTDQLTRIERMLVKLIESGERLEESTNELKEKLPEQLYDLREELGQIAETVRDKTHDKPNYGIGGGGMDK